MASHSDLLSVPTVIAPFLCSLLKSSAWLYSSFGATNLTLGYAWNIDKSVHINTKFVEYGSFFTDEASICEKADQLLQGLLHNLRLTQSHRIFSFRSNGHPPSPSLFWRDPSPFAIQLPNPLIKTKNKIRLFFIIFFGENTTHELFKHALIFKHAVDKHRMSHATRRSDGGWLSRATAQLNSTELYFHLEIRVFFHLSCFKCERCRS